MGIKGILKMYTFWMDSYNTFLSELYLPGIYMVTFLYELDIRYRPKYKHGLQSKPLRQLQIQVFTPYLEIVLRSNSNVSTHNHQVQYLTNIWTADSLLAVIL